MRTTLEATELLESIAVVVLGGVLMAFALFVVTASTPTDVYIGLCQPTTVAAFDPWTGEPHGPILDCHPFAGSPVTRLTTDPPTELIGRRAVPLPLGFGLGALIALMWLRSSGGWPSRPWNPEGPG